ncbi:MAG TPA: carboxypeptidase-like regulatory domain-containing protein [Longimicrobiales bacterium]|nr:carboxypeptidase-like regulatory domain-containing protein [Longimicrobiales bacterium]
MERKQVSGVPPARRLRVLVAVLAAALLQAAGVAGQDITGTVRTDAGDAVSGAMVMLRQGERTVHAAISGAGGEFSLRAPAPGSYHVRAEGIGYATASTGPLEVPDAGLADVDVRLEIRPLTLHALEVSGASQCAVRPDDGMPAHTLWDEAAKVLRSTALLQELELIEYSVATWERDVSLTRGREHTERHPPQLVRGRPFMTRSPADLAAGGWVEEIDGEVLYHGPDAEVLLSDDFLDTHCIRVERRGADRPGVIGIGFEPARGPDAPGIQGVLWLDEVSGELQYLTYDYTGLDSPRIAPAGGRIEFSRLDGGGWIVEQWWIRMQRRAPDRNNPRRWVTQGYLEMGGVVSDVRRTGR